MNWLQYVQNRPRMNPEGDGSLGVLFMGEALGEHEEADRLPFRPWAEAGSLLTRALRRANIPRDRLTLSNMVWYRPPDNKLSGMPWEAEAIEHSWPLNEALIRERDPKVIVALGGVAFRELTGFSGKKLGISSARGFIVPSKVGIPVVGTYHPSYIRRGSKQKGDSGARTETPGGGTMGMALLGVLIRDIKLAVEIVQNRPVFEANEYILDATLDDWRRLLQDCILHPEWILSYDFETTVSIVAEDEAEEDVRMPGQEPTQFQLSVRPGHALVSRWSPDLLRILRTFFALPNPKLDWNGRKFDRPLLRDLGISPSVGLWHDGMDLWHHAQPDLQRGLQFATSFACPEVGPWKHLSYSDPLLYGAYDVDMPQRIWNYLEGSMGKIQHQISSVNLWEGYRDQVARLSPVLDRMGDRGIPVDDEQRIALGVEYDRTLEGIERESAEIAPWQVRPLHPKRGYKKIPKGLPNYFDETSSAGDLRKFFDYRERLDQSEEFIFKHFVGGGEEFARWAQLLPFNIGSASQIKDYLRFRKWKIPHHPATDKETADALALHKVLKQHPDKLLEMRLEYMGVKKARSTYVEGWKPGPDGRVHPMFGFKPATGQMSSENPNCFSDDTEVLTENGWKLFSGLLSGERLAQFDEGTGEIDFALPEHYVDFDVRGDMMHIYSDKQIDLLVTPDHQCLLQNRKTKSWKRFRGEDYPEDWYQLHAGHYIGGTVNLSKAKLILIAAFQADGHIFRAKRLKANRITFGFSKERKIIRLREALRDEGITYTERSGKKRVTTFYVHAPDWLMDWKTFDRRILDLDRESFEFLAEEVWKWDGSAKRRTMYASKNKTNSDWVQILTSLVGRRARIRRYDNGSESWQVDATDQDYSLTTHTNVDYVPYVGKVYCVTMPKHTVIVRRNGRVAVTGQSQNFPKHGKLAKAMRRMIRASTGKKFVSFDYKSFHVLTTGFEAGDPSYMRLARLDMHSFFALTGLLKLEAPEKLLSLQDGELMEKLAWYRKNAKIYPEYATSGHPGGMTFGEIRDEQAKRTILGAGFGLSGRGMFKRNPDSFSSVQQAESVKQMLIELFPLEERWRGEIRREADRYANLVTRYGYIRWFWDVFARQLAPPKYSGSKKVVEDSEGRKWLISPGDDHEACVAYRPANDAFGIKRGVMVWLGEKGLDERYGLIDEIHDDLTFETPNNLIDEVIELVKYRMELPSPYLVSEEVPNGLWCEVEVSVGDSFAEMEKIKV